jgi:hypothetical protein
VLTLGAHLQTVGYPRRSASTRDRSSSPAISILGLPEGVVLDFSRPGKPTDNSFIESFNGKFRTECLNTHWFLSLDDARQKMEDWRRDYNEVGHIARSATRRRYRC